MLHRLAPFLLLSLCIACGGGTDGTPVAPPAVPVPNRGPTPVGTIPEQVLRLGDEPTTLNIAPDGEDIAESILPYFAVRYRPERLTEADRSAILAAIPNRLVYFDEQGFDMSPYSARGSTARVFGLSPFQP